METSNQLRNFSALKKSKVQSLPEIRAKHQSCFSANVPTEVKPLPRYGGRIKYKDRRCPQPAKTMKLIQIDRICMRKSSMSTLFCYLEIRARGVDPLMKVDSRWQPTRWHLRSKGRSSNLSLGCLGMSWDNWTVWLHHRDSQGASCLLLPRILRRAIAARLNSAFNFPESHPNSFPGVCAH